MALNTAKTYNNSTSKFSIQLSASKLVRAVLSLLVTWQTRASMRTKLKNLDEENLTDMGISSQQVKREIAKPFWWR